MRERRREREGKLFSEEAGMDILTGQFCSRASRQNSDVWRWSGRVLVTYREGKLFVEFSSVVVESSLQISSLLHFFWTLLRLHGVRDCSQLSVRYASI
jgi:hypothetical protein